jgi:hypothetical protein
MLSAKKLQEILVELEDNANEDYTVDDEVLVGYLTGSFGKGVIKFYSNLLSDLKNELDYFKGECQEAEEVQQCEEIKQYEEYVKVVEEHLKFLKSVEKMLNSVCRHLDKCQEEAISDSEYNEIDKMLSVLSAMGR